jgi:ribonucleoside-diphosphate reductase alpha chain
VAAVRATTERVVQHDPEASSVGVEEKVTSRMKSRIDLTLGSSSGSEVVQSVTPTMQASAASEPKPSGLSTAMAELQEDAPACEVCGTITVRNGTCYRCLNCGHSMGCS